MVDFNPHQHYYYDDQIFHGSVDEIDIEEQEQFYKQDNFQQEQKQEYLYSKNYNNPQYPVKDKKIHQFQDSLSPPEDINHNISQTLSKNQIQPHIQHIGNALCTEDKSTIQNNQYYNYCASIKNQTEQLQKNPFQAQKSDDYFPEKKSTKSLKFDQNYNLDSNMEEYTSISQEQQKIQNEQQLLLYNQQYEKKQDQEQYDQQQQKQYEDEQQYEQQHQQQYEDEYEEEQQQEISEQKLGILKKAIQKKEPRRKFIKIKKQSRPLRFVFQLLKSFLHYDGKYSETASEQKIRKNLTTQTNIMTEAEIETHIQNLKIPLQELRQNYSQYLSKQQVFDEEIKDKLLAFQANTVKGYYTLFKNGYKKGYFNKYNNLREEELTISHIRKEIKGFKCNLKEFSILDVIQFLNDTNN